MALGRKLVWGCKLCGGDRVMEEVYRELEYMPKKTGWKFELMFFTTIVIPLTILIGISCLASLPILIKEKWFE